MVTHQRSLREENSVASQATGSSNLRHGDTESTDFRHLESYTALEQLQPAASTNGSFLHPLAAAGCILQVAKSDIEAHGSISKRKAQLLAGPQARATFSGNHQTLK
eukprot:s423_g9.t1